MFKIFFYILKIKNIFLSCVNILILILLMLHGIYLDIISQNKIKNNIYISPSKIYSKSITLNKNTNLNKKNIIKILKKNKYKKKYIVINNGEYKIHKNKIEFIKKNNNPNNKINNNKHIELIFNKKNKLKKITNKTKKKKINSIKLDPILINTLQFPIKKKKIYLKINKIPKTIITILLITEDKNFYKHDGIEFLSIIRSLIKNNTKYKKKQGASTITQQLIKNFFLYKKKFFLRKINEALISLIINYRYKKNKIIELYINNIFLGQSGDFEIIGLPLASIYYFNSKINKLTIDKQVILISMIKGATIYNPIKKINNIIKRKKIVLFKIKKEKIINKKTYLKIKKKTIKITKKKINNTINEPTFMQILEKEIKKKFKNKMHYLSGTKIFTTLDIISQKYIKKSINKIINYFKNKKKIKNLQISILIINKYNGKIKYTIGNIKNKYYEYNRVIHSKRQIGSLIKPIIYITSLNKQNKYKLNTWIKNNNLNIKQKKNTTWKPKNYCKIYNKKVMIINSLSNSFNISTVNLGMSIGIKNIFYKYNKLKIIKNKIKNNNPSILLGSICLSTMDITKQYQPLLNNGIYTKFSSIEKIINKNKKIIFLNKNKKKRLFNKQTSYLILHLLQQTFYKGTSYKTSIIYSKKNLAGKTGTTNNLKDSWFIGSNNNEIITIWIGKDNNETINLSGSTGALIIFNEYIKHKKSYTFTNKIPKNIFFLQIDNYGNFIYNKNNTINKEIKSIPVWIK